MAAKISPNSVWRFSEDFGHGPGYVPAGSEVVVSGVYPPGTPGLGASDEDVVLVRLPRPNADPQAICLPVSTFKAVCKAVS